MRNKEARMAGKPPQVSGGVLKRYELTYTSIEHRHCGCPHCRGHEMNRTVHIRMFTSRPADRKIKAKELCVKEGWIENSISMDTMIRKRVFSIRLIPEHEFLRRMGFETLFENGESKKSKRGKK